MARAAYCTADGAKGRSGALQFMAVEERIWRIGEVATATGLTVRALHH
jgi:hypothetical protein